MALAATQQEITTVAALAALVDHQRIMGLIQPFVAHVDFSDLRKPQVRLDHQSVKEFVLRDLASKSPGSEASAVSTTSDRAFISQRIENLEAKILAVCIRYLLLDDIGHTDLFSDEQTAIEELPQGPDLFDDDGQPNLYDHYCTWEVWEKGMIRYDPTDRGFGEFFVCAACNWLEHFGTVATASSPPRLKDIERLCQAGSTRLHNWIERYRRCGCAIKPRFPLDGKVYDSLGITSLYGSEPMLREMLDKSEFDKGNFLSDSVMQAAEHIVHWGDLSRLELFFSESKVSQQLRNPEFLQLVKERCSASHEHDRDGRTFFDIAESEQQTSV